MKHCLHGKIVPRRVWLAPRDDTLDDLARPEAEAGWGISSGEDGQHLGPDVAHPQGTVRCDRRSHPTIRLQDAD
jgi:hypothetical protein